MPHPTVPRPETEYQAQHFRTYELAVPKLSLGFVNTDAGGYTPSLGETLQYDGSTVILSDGREFKNVPELRGAIREGWFVPVGDAPTAYHPKPAGIEVRATEQRGMERVTKRAVETLGDDQRFVGNVEARRVSREKTNADAGKRVSLSSDLARSALGQEPPSRTEDPMLADFFGAMDNVTRKWEDARRMPQEFAQAEADIIALLNAVAEDDDPSETVVAPSPSAVVPSPASARSLPVEREEHLRMPVVREDPTENAGTVVATVESRTSVERPRETEINVAPAAPHVPKMPYTRFGSSGVVIVDEQRDMGQIALSETHAPISLDESAKVRPATTDMVRMGDVEVGRRKRASAVVSETDQGVAVGRILSPTRFDSVDITHPTQSRQALAEVSRNAPTTVEPVKRSSVATGDVDEPRSGDTLEELLPEAAKPARVYKPEAEDPAYAAVRMLLPEFKWNRDRPVKDRVAEALTHIKNPMFVKAILVVETELVRKEIEQRIAELVKQREGTGSPPS